MTFLDINDWQLTARRSDGGVICREHVAAYSTGGKLQFGDAALDQSRSHPQQFNNKYFYSLAADPLAGDLRPAKNHADLIYHHLAQLDLPTQEPLTLCVSGHLTNQQLGLLLGICQEVNLQVAGFLDLALAQSLALDMAADFHVLDIELHRMTLSHISIDQQTRSQHQTIPVDGVGVANVVEAWMNVIADEFIQKTRYDPLHAGDSEQQLFDQVRTWLMRTELTDQRATVVNGEASRDIEIGRELLRNKLRQRLDRLDLEQVNTLALTPRAAGIPGLVPLLSERVATLLPISESDIAQNYSTLSEGLEAGDTRRIRQARVSIPAPGSATEHADTDARAESPAATHLLTGHLAYPLDRAIFTDHIDPRTACTLSTAVSVNGQQAPGIRIAPGDQVGIAEQSYVAIRLV